jgi:adenylate cyclase
MMSLPGTNLPFEGSIYDLMLHYRPRPESALEKPKIVIIAIDDATLNNPYQTHPELFSPVVWASILDALVLGGAKVVAIHRPLPSTEGRAYPLEEEAIWFSSVQQAKRDFVPVIYGFRWFIDLPFFPSPKFIEIMGQDKLGFLNLIHDRDNKVRSLAINRTIVAPMEENSGDRDEGPEDVRLSFAYLAAKAMDPAMKELKGNFYIDYGGVFTKVSFNQVYEQAIHGQIDFFKHLFGEALVLIGDTSSQNLDAYPTPNSAYASGDRGWNLTSAVEIQAQGIETLLLGLQIKNPSWLTLWAFFFGLMVLALLPILLSAPKDVYLLPWLPAAVLIAYPVVAFIAFRRYVFLPVIPGVSILLLANALYWGVKAREAKKIQRTSSQALNLYLNPALAGQIIHNPEILQRRGEQRIVTVLFADIVGFTSMAETMETAQMVDILNQYYDSMNTAIERYDGFVDKFVGDAIMAVWGAPSSQPRHAVAACLSALMQQKLLEDLNRNFSAAGQPLLHALIGLNTGSVIAGNIGAKQRLNYTVMGDTVNLASRLVGVNKIFNTTILASEATVAMAKEEVCFRTLDRVRVKGRKGSLKVYEVMAPIGGLTPQQAQAVNYFERALNHYWSRDFSGALLRAEAALKVLPTDIPSQILAQKCREFIPNPPGQDWDGVTFLEIK